MRPVNPVLSLCSTMGAWAAVALPLVRVAPNRLMSGAPVYWAALIPTWGWLVWLPLILLSFYPSRHSDKRVAAGLTKVFGTRLASAALMVVMSLSMAAMLWLAGSHATTIAHTESMLARTSLGAGFWCLTALIWLVSMDTVKTLTRSDMLRITWLMLVALPSLALIGTGHCDNLSIMKEYTNRSEVFWVATQRHLQIVATAIVPSVMIGLPLAWACAHLAALRKMVFPVLNIIQTIPSIALFGLLMAPLALAATRWHWLGEAGISGVGLAPAVIALVLYNLLPIVRSALAGLEQVPVDAKTAAKAMGMSNWQIFFKVEVPLALPVWLPGLRTAIVQTIGLTAVTALVGAGGLGALMFDGLFSAANELVLLGVLPIVLLAILTDALFTVLSAWIAVSPVGSAPVELMPARSV
ncbi:ABC transporter permease [Rhodoferax sp.]|uniref:ABC transporter permease n=1 Tax=Rhodoferax sp. TaxID=50421 RepID=UPI0028420A4F|nr:ABC transporter permease [Rhodoferax sp.]MDR3370789.1 ABC transporter permease [Rhodoferax sp.]